MHEAMHIAYAPAAYYRPWREAYASATVDQQRWLNATLIRQRRLPMPAARVDPADMVTRRLLGLWPNLPQIATLMAAARLAAWLPSQRGCAALPATVQAFMRAGHVPQPVARVQDPVPADLAGVLLTWGGVELQPLAPLLPAWLSARLSLPFAPMAGDGLRPLPRERIDMDLFWTAVTYVEKLS